MLPSLQINTKMLNKNSIRWSKSISAVQLTKATKMKQGWKMALKKPTVGF